MEDLDYTGHLESWFDECLEYISAHPQEPIYRIVVLIFAVLGEMREACPEECLNRAADRLIQFMCQEVSERHARSTEKYELHPINRDAYGNELDDLWNSAVAINAIFGKPEGGQLDEVIAQVDASLQSLESTEAYSRTVYDSDRLFLSAEEALQLCATLNEVQIIEQRYSFAGIGDLAAERAFSLCFTVGQLEEFVELYPESPLAEEAYNRIKTLRRKMWRNRVIWCVALPLVVAVVTSQVITGYVYIKVLSLLAVACAYGFLYPFAKRYTGKETAFGAVSLLAVVTVCCLFWGANRLEEKAYVERIIATGDYEELLKLSVTCPQQYRDTVFNAYYAARMKAFGDSSVMDCHQRMIMELGSWGYNNTFFCVRDISFVMSRRDSLAQELAHEIVAARDIERLISMMEYIITEPSLGLIIEPFDEAFETLLPDITQNEEYAYRLAYLGEQKYISAYLEAFPNGTHAAEFED